ncbi:MAG: hypothetical protein DHS20C13_20140 [Thermodesulfobacteriota bacterium]|nr:MAG: hypothetical protein DHS20C13_20140 [Thermodesulfobacteriota bacterium]
MNPLQSFEYFIFDDNNLVVPFEQLTNSPSGGGIFSGPVTNTAATRVAFTASANYNPPGTNASGARQLYLSEISFNPPNPAPNTLFQLTNLPDNDFFNQGADMTGDGQRIVFASNYAITGMSPDPERDIFIADVGDPQNPVFTRITKSAEFTASSAEIDSAGNNIVFITENPQFAPVKDGDTETIVMADIINPANPSFMSLANFPPGTDIDDLSAPNEFTFFAFESDDDLVSGGINNESEQIYLLFTDQCPVIAVPTLSEWGLIAMASILGIFGFMVMRRRKALA